MNKSNAEIIAGFETTIPEAEKAVVAAARNVATYSGQTGDIDVLRQYANLQFFVTQVDLDIRVGLRNLLADTSVRITTESTLPCHSSRPTGVSASSSISYGSPLRSSTVVARDS